MPRMQAAADPDDKRRAIESARSDTTRGAGVRSMQQLVQLRWIALLGQLATILFVHYALEIHLPLARRGLLAALTLVFVDVMKELPATLLLRPFGLETLAVVIWRRTAESLWLEAAVPALALVLAGLGPVALAIWATGSNARPPGARAGLPPP